MDNFLQEGIGAVWYLGSFVAKTEDIGLHTDNALNMKPGFGS